MGEVVDIGNGIASGSDPLKLEILDLSEQAVVVEFGEKAILFRGARYLNMLDIEGYFRSIELQVEQTSSGSRSTYHSFGQAADSDTCQGESDAAYSVRGGSGARVLVDNVSQHVAGVILDRIQTHLRARIAPSMATSLSNQSDSLSPVPLDENEYDLHVPCKKSHWKEAADFLFVSAIVVVGAFAAAAAAHGGWVAGARLLAKIGITV